MKCSCPKCGAQSEVDHTAVSEGGINPTCPECNARFWVSPESFARRAFRKDGTLHCAACGHELNHLIVCRSCGIRCPDYFAVQSTKLAGIQKQQKAKVSFNFNFDFKRKSGNAGKSPSAAAKSSQVTSGSSKPLLAKLGIPAVAVLVIAAGFFGYRHYQAQQNFMKSFVMATYGIKSGKDLAVKICNRVSSDAKIKLAAGQSPLRATQEEEGRLQRAKESIDSTMKRINPPPTKFAKDAEKLAKLFAVYERANNLALDKSIPFPALGDAAAKIETDFKQAGQDLKAGLAPELSEKLQSAQSKLANFKDF